MERPATTLKSLIFDLYLQPNLLVIGFYLVIVTATFTAQQLLLAAYLDELGHILISGIILNAYYILWLVLGPICGTLSDLHGRKFLLIAGNWISCIGFFGLIISPEPLFLILMNATIGVGSALRVGSIIALWVQHSPQDRVGESLAFNNILLSIGGIGGGALGFIMWLTIKELSFIVFGISLFLTAIPIIFVTDSGDYTPISFDSVIGVLKEKPQQKFFVTRPIIQISIHWVAFSTIISFSTYIFPILEEVQRQGLWEQIPNEIPLPLLLIILIASITSVFGGLIIWGRISDAWSRKFVLIVGFLGSGFLLLLLGFLVSPISNLVHIIEGLINGEIFSYLILGILLLSIFTAISLIPTPMAWITDKVGQEDLAKAMSLRNLSIGIGTIIGLFLGGFILGSFGIGGLLLVILMLLIISAIILL
ncbi:MAG: MFS transporter [Candidatus Heimdallarchaeota archaeon]|nr:MAG: MFS transporter [Candidatus Heimdallarchaeota archaeon]